MKYEVHPGQRVTDASAELGEGAILITDGVPDTVRLPADIDPGRPWIRVLGGLHEPCPCRGAHASLTLRLDRLQEAPDGEVKRLHVAECAVRGFLWFLVPTSTEDA